MNRMEVDRALGQTPCICGDVEAWHPQCYARFLGRPKHEIDAAMDRAYRTARRKLKERAKAQAGEALMMANAEVSGAASSRPLD
jgi:hypothetical protein